MRAIRGPIGCPTCGQVQELDEVPAGQAAHCARCGTVLLRGGLNVRSRTAALSLAALFLYVPANLYPVMIMDYAGQHSENTVWDGVVKLCQDGSWFVASIVFAASILVPLLKLLGLFWLVSSTGNRWQQERTWVYKTISVLGPWAMLDVFLLAVSVALVRFGKFATVLPGPGIIAFTGVVVLTILASSSFDSRVIWEEQGA
jgi:paraquat-inducible protein A